MKVVCIVQARMGSTRLPGKSMMTIGEWPLIEHVLTRCLLIPNVDQVVLAVPNEAASDDLESVADALEIETYWGPEHDVLKRYTLAAKQHKADVICRITGDCPLLDPVVAGLVIQPVKDGQADYCSNVHPRTWEKGLDVEAFTLWSLLVADRDATKASDREHVTPFIYENPVVRLANVAAPPEEEHDPKLNWSVDTKTDLARVRKEFKRRFPDD